MKEGKKEEAESAKSKTAQYKESSSELKSQLEVKETELLNILYQLPNIPNELVKSGASADDNEIIFQSHTVEGLGEGAIPHWELAKNITLLTLN